MDSFSGSVEKKKWTLEKETEFRFEVAEGSTVKIKVSKIYLFIQYILYSFLVN